MYFFFLLRFQTTSMNSFCTTPLVMKIKRKIPKSTSVQIQNANVELYFTMYLVFIPKRV